MREGDYGEARRICTNDACEKRDPFWPNKRLQQKLKPLNDEIDRVSVFSEGQIEMNTARWVGDGSFTVMFNDGRNVECYVDGSNVFPDQPEINQEIRDKFQKLIVLRKKLFAKVDE
jgi:hypothetical protein